MTSTSDTRVLCREWTGDCQDAVCVAFDVKCYTRARLRALDYVFYGIAENTAAAATSMEMVSIIGAESHDG
jgi:hypothetical protein